MKTFITSDIHLNHKQEIFIMNKEITYTVKVNETGTFWYLNGHRHRVDGPAAIYANGEQYWYLNGKYHRVDGPAITYANGTQFWFLDGLQHRVAGPAVTYVNGTQVWYLNGHRHRVDGPAITCSNGDQFWFLNGVKLTEEEFNAKTNPVKELTVAEIEKLLGHKVKIVK